MFFLIDSGALQHREIHPQHLLLGLIHSFDLFIFFTNIKKGLNISLKAEVLLHVNVDQQNQLIG